ncbi:MAG TPA: primosomal protein N' [Bacillota bacterium]|nr:primosomal protein N' [Bacillota bacterium]
MKIAKVLIGLNMATLDRLFDYAVPSRLESSVRIGARAVVPFQNKPTIAYVWEITDHSEFESLKELIQVIDDPPLIGPDLFKLVNWLAPYYCCSRVDVLKLCLPPGSGLTRQTSYQLNVDENHLQHSLIMNFPDLAVDDLIQAMIKLSLKCAPSEEWRKLFKKQTEVLDLLIKQQLLVKIDGLSRPKVKAKTSKVFCWNASDDLKESAAGQRVKAVLLARELGLSRSELCAAAEVSPAVIARLQKEGKICCTELQCERVPVGMQQIAQPRQVAFNSEQQQVYQEIKNASADKPFLLHGITGSGKTEIYFELAVDAINQGKQVLYLVPEIALTPQTLERARARFGGQVALLHSNMSDGERFDQWYRIKNGAARFVLGARSAIFAPLENLGLIIVDEEHETTYKQEDTPRYHARKVVEMLAELTGSKLVFGSATPSVESFYRAEIGAYRLVKLEKRFNAKPLPEVTIVDMRAELQRKNKNVLSDLLFREIQNTLERREQVILFLNRRGHSTFILCRDCGQALQCPACEVSLTYHSYENQLRCHYCDYRQPVPDLCSNCQSTRIRYFGNGTQKLEAELAEAFTGARIVRMDHDSTANKGAHHQIYQELISGAVDILLGTQMIAKGLDLPRVTLVGVISADSTLNMPDFRAAERCFHLLTQVAGRAGRGEKSGQVIFQTYNPEHYAIQFAQKHDFYGFYQTEIAQRRTALYPPFSELVKVGFAGMDETKVISAAENFADLLRSSLEELTTSSPEARGEVNLLGPAPAVIAKVQNLYRWQLIVKTANAPLLEQVVQHAWQNYPYRKYPDVRIIRDRNPYSVL